MIRRLVLKALDAAERRLGEPLDFVRYMFDASPGAFLTFSSVSPTLWRPSRLPADAYFTAMIVATRYEDCGPCVQTGVNFARKAGVPVDTLRAVVERRPHNLEPALRDVYHFATAVAAGSDDDGDLRARLVARYGDAGVVELAMAIARGRFYPTIKRGLGYATSCALVDVRV